MPTTPLLEAREVCRRKPGESGWLIDKLSLCAKAGERISVRGPTGAGKTLLLRALALLDPVDGGEVLWHGHAVQESDVPAFRSQVIYLQQRPALVEGTVEENLRRPFELRRHQAAQFDCKRVVNLLADVGRDEAFLRKLARDLSGGEAQITATLRAIQLDPTVLLLDEPTAALDAAATQAIEQLVLNWQSEQQGSRAIVWVSHDSEQSARIATRVVHLRDGRIVQEQ